MGRERAGGGCRPVQGSSSSIAYKEEREEGSLVVYEVPLVARDLAPSRHHAELSNPFQNLKVK